MYIITLDAHFVDLIAKIRHRMSKRFQVCSAISQYLLFRHRRLGRSMKNADRVSKALGQYILKSVVAFGFRFTKPLSNAFSR